MCMDDGLAATAAAYAQLGGRLLFLADVVKEQVAKVQAAIAVAQGRKLQPICGTTPGQRGGKPTRLAKATWRRLFDNSP